MVVAEFSGKSPSWEHAQTNECSGYISGTNYQKQKITNTVSPKSVLVPCPKADPSEKFHENLRTSFFVDVSCLNPEKR